MKATIEKNKITIEGGYVIECQFGELPVFFRIDGKIKFFDDDDPCTEGICDLIRARKLGTSISAIQFNVVCNEIKSKISSE